MGFETPYGPLVFHFSKTGGFYKQRTRLASTTFPTYLGEVEFKGRGFRDVQRTGGGDFQGKQLGGKQSFRCQEIFPEIWETETGSIL